MRTYRTHSARETVELGRKFAAELKPGDCVALSGTLGSGKTQFVIGVCEGLHARTHATSPTFTFINEYAAPFGTVVHIDLYRIEKPSEVDALGVEEYFNDRCICLIEWPELMADRLPPQHYAVELRHGAAEDEREIVIREAVAA
jgi:tRNA threonylcarbamoyladenosine biosynthesis protein TsaE